MSNYWIAIVSFAATVSVVVIAGVVFLLTYWPGWRRSGAPGCYARAGLTGARRMIIRRARRAVTV